MEFDLFQFLDGISPWWWIALAFGLGAIEVLTFSFFLIWPGLAAVGVAVMMWLFPGMSGNSQMLWFAVMSVIFTLAGRQFVLSRKPTSDQPNLNQRGAALIGRNAEVVDGFAAGGLGNVLVDGMRWRARLAEGTQRPAAGDVLDIVEAEGMILILQSKAAGP